MGWDMIARLLVVGLLLLCPASLWATAYTSTQAGSASSSATWGGVGVPGDGDTISIGHSVTVDSALTVGAGGATGTTAIAITGGGLTVSSQLIVKGDIVQNKGVSVTGTTGGSITFAPPSGATYVWATATTGTGYASINLTGSSGSRFIVSTAQGAGGNFYFNETNSGFVFVFDYVILNYIGDDSTPAMSKTGLWNAHHFVLNHTLINHCGTVNRVWAGGETIANIIFTNSDIRSSLETGSTYAFRLYNNTVPTTSTRTVENVTIYGVTGKESFDIGALYGATVKNIYAYNATVSCSGQSAEQLAFFVDSGYTATSSFLTVSNQWGNTYKDIIFLSNKNNPHYIDEGSATGSSTPNIYTGIIFDGDGYVGTDAGDCLIVGGGNATMRNNIAINKAGTLATLLRSNSKLTATNNTSYNSYHITIGETVGGSTQAKEIKNNLFTSQDAGIYQETAFVTQTDFNLGNNAYYNITTAANIDYSGNNTYVGPESRAVWWSTGAYGDAGKGSGDIYADPQFVDPARTVRGFGGWTSVQDAAREMVTINGIAYDGMTTTPTAKTVSAMANWIKSGFAPTNSALKTAGYGGTYIGAMDVVSLGNPAAALLMVQ